MSAAIEVRGLKKSYGPVEAVRGVDLTVEGGEVFALLGPNGAGKTTTVEILEGYRDRDAGTVSVLGHDPATRARAYKQRIGIVLQETGVERYLTVSEVIDLYRSYYPSPRPRDEIIDVVGLREKRDELVRRLSGGQQRRLDVAIGLAGDPELLFLDEPTTGFDPTARRNAWQMVKTLKALGKTVLLTTHYMDEAQYLADRVGLIVAGKIVAEGPPRTLAAATGNVTIVQFYLAADAPELPSTFGASVDDGVVQIRTSEPTKVLHGLTTWAIDNDVELGGLNVAQPSLEDVYLELTASEEPK